MTNRQKAARRKGSRLLNETEKEREREREREREIVEIVSLLQKKRKG